MSKKHCSTWLLFLVAGAAFCQSPASFVKIIKLDPPTTQGAEPNIEFQNIGTRPIRIVFLRNTDENAGTIRYVNGGDSKVPVHGLIQRWETLGTPLVSGATAKVNVWTDVEATRLTDQIKVVAVVFTDGSHVGSAPNPILGGKDSVADIFEEWQGTADSLALWKKTLASGPQEDRGWLAAFFSRTAEDYDKGTSPYGWGVARGNAIVRSIVTKVRPEVEKGERSEMSARAFIEQSINQSLKSATARAKDGGELQEASK